MLSINDFNPVELSDKYIFDQFYKKYPPLHSDYVFTTIISWKSYVQFYFANLKENLVIMTKIGDNFRFRPPIGEFNKSLFHEVIELAKKQNSENPFGIIDIKTKEWLSRNFTNLRFIPHRDYFDYVYLSSALAELPGQAYAKIRNRLNKFTRNYDYKIEKISKKNMEEIRKFLNRWCLWKDCNSDPLLENEKNAI